MSTTTTPRIATCDCGTELALDTQQEVDHYVWSLRPNGERSNLGSCPLKDGLAVAQSKAARYGGGIFMSAEFRRAWGLPVSLSGPFITTVTRRPADPDTGR